MIESANEFQKHMLPIFVTPVANYLLPDHQELNQQLQSAILQMAELDSGVSRSNVGGWHSSLDFLERDLECVKIFSEKINSLVKLLLLQFYAADALPAYRLEGWANVLRYGEYNSVHAHPNSAWSAVYYVTANEKIAKHPFSGKLELLDPRVAANLTYTDQSGLYGRFLLSPVAGQIILFPSWLQHQVHAYFGKEARISIAVNVNMEAA